MAELIQSYIKEFTRKQKGGKKMKHRKRDPGSGLSSSKSTISRTMRGRIPKIPTFFAIRNQQQEESTASHSEQPSTSSATSAAAKQPQRSWDRNRRNASYYGFENSSPDLAIAAPAKRPRRAGDVENYQPHLSQLSKLCSILQISSRLKSISPPE